MPSAPTIKGEKLSIIFLFLLGGAIFSIADALTKYMTVSYDPSFIIALGAGLNSIAICVWILFKKGWRGFLSPNWKWLNARAIMTGIMATCAAYSLKYIPLNDLYGVIFAAPFMILILSGLFLKEKIGRHRWAAVIIGFIGVIILLGPQFKDFSIGYIFAVGTMIAIAMSTIITRKVGDKEYLPLFVLYPGIGILIVNLPIAIPNMVIPPVHDWWLFASQSTVVCVAQFLTTYAISRANYTASLSPFMYAQAIWGILLGVLFFADIPSSMSIIGTIIIISAGLYMIYRERQLTQNVKTS